MAHFSLSNSVPLSWLYILNICIGVSNTFWFLANSFMSSMRWIFFCDLVSLYPPVHLWSLWLGGTITIKNINDDTAFLWKKLSGFSHQLNCLPLLSVPLSIFCGFLNKLCDSISCTFWGSTLSNFAGLYRTPFVVNLRQSYIFVCVAFCSLLGFVGQYIVGLLIFLRHPFCSKNQSTAS